MYRTISTSRVGRQPGLVTDDNLEAFAWCRLVVCGVAVHDGERRSLDDALTLLFGNALPGVARTGRVKADSVGMDALGFRGRQPAKRLQALRKLLDDLRILVDRREPGDQI